MSKELKGKNGKIVGATEYFNALNINCELNYVMSNYKFNYFSSIKSIAKNCSKKFDEVYDDIDDNLEYLYYIDNNDKAKTIEIIEGMADLCKIASVNTSKADKCVKLLTNSKSQKSKSGASYSDITKSASLVISNKYFNKKDSIKILEDTIKYGKKKAVKVDAKKEKFIQEVERSKKSGYLEDVYKIVLLFEGKKKTTGKCRELLCSKAYNNHVASAVTGSAGSKGNVDYGRIIRGGLRSVVIEVQKDLENGIKNYDYIKDENKDSLVKFVEDIEKCGIKCYNSVKLVYELNWFVGGDPNKIKRLQQTLVAQGYKDVLTDGVYGKYTEAAWLDYVNKKVEAYDPYNWVVGIGVQGAVHPMMWGVSGSIMVYIDDDFNIAIMVSGGGEAGTGIDASIGANLEWSTTARTVDDMAGRSVTTGAGGRIPGTKYDVNIGRSVATVDGYGVVTSNSLGIGMSGGLSKDLKYGINGGVSTNISVASFNPKEWVESALDIK